METVLIVSSVLLWVVVLINLLLTLALVRRVNSGMQQPGAVPALSGLSKGDVAPDFSATTLQGETVTLGTYTGSDRLTAFIVIEPDCGPCREGLPTYKALYPDARRSGVDLVLVSIGEIEATRELAGEFKISMPLIVAPRSENSFFTDYKVRGTPNYCLIDGDGKVLSAGHPFVQSGDWKAIMRTWTSTQSQDALLPAVERR